jgi:biphenyl-2,3-diol 1,2-dioxygenase
MAVTQLGYIGLGVSDLDAWCDYATGVLGMEISGREEGLAYLRMDEMHHRVILHEDDLDDLAYAGWQTPNRDAFEQTLAEMEAAGIAYERATPEELTQRMVMAMARFELSGVPMEVFYGPKAVFELPFRPSARISGFRTGDMGMGHIAFAGDDPKELARLMIEGLGFEVGDSFSGFECLLRCNRRENTVFIPASPYSCGKRLNHFMLELKAIDDVGSGLDRCEDNGVEITSRLGRHTNDLSISFYMRTPSGFRVEYGWDSKTTDQGEWPVRDYERSSVWGHRPPAKVTAKVTA